MLISRMRDVAADLFPGGEGAVGQLDAEPGAEFGLVANGAPDTRARGFDEDLLLDAICHVQPPGCKVACNRSVAQARARRPGGSTARHRCSIELRVYGFSSAIRPQYPHAPFAIKGCSGSGLTPERSEPL